jgi:uncharacterized protein (DUF2141 family)
MPLFISHDIHRQHTGETVINIFPRLTYRLRTIRLPLLMLLTAALASALPVRSAEETQPGTQSGNLTVIVTGASSTCGTICIALYADEEQWENRKPEVRTAVVPVQKGPTMHVFQNIPFGTYAIKAFHDANDNMQLDKDTIGKPAEAYGFSRNARGRFGPPTFKDACLPLYRSQQIEMTLR